MANLVTSKDAAASTALSTRRSTRVFQAVPLSISGQNRIGNLFLESTSAVSVNCHGCLYPSRHEYRHGSWVTIEVPNQQVNCLPRPVRAQVKFVRLPSNPQELYLVGVELESPANVWGIKIAPEDWRRFPNAAGVGGSVSAAPVNAGGLSTSAVAEQKMHLLPELAGIPSAEAPAAHGGRLSEPRTAVLSATGPGIGAEVQVTSNFVKPDHAAAHDDPGAPAVTPASAQPVVSEQLLRLLDGKLQQAAEKAVAAALNSRLTVAVNQAVKALENFSQANLRQVEAHCSQYRETLVTSAREDLLGRMKVDLSHAGEHLRSQVEEFSSKTLETVHQLEKSAAQVQPAVAAAQASLQNVARELEDQFAARMRDAVGSATAEFNSETGHVSQRQLARLSEKAHAAGGEAARAIDARSTEARLQLESAAGAALGEFHQRAGIEIDLAVTESRKSIESSVAAIAAETSANWEARQQACEQAVAGETENRVEQFRRRLSAIVNSSLTVTMSAINQHSGALLDTLAKEAAQQEHDHHHIEGA